MKTNIEFLLECQPNWVSIQKKEAKRIFIIASPPKGDSGLECHAYRLELKLDGKVVKVKEIVEGNADRLLPTACPCRHINASDFDFAFCLGYDCEVKVTNLRTARYWWEHLSQFLVSQEVAENTKVWPQSIDQNGKAHNEMSHGQAAYHQLEAEKFARELGIQNCYDEALSQRLDLLGRLAINKKMGRGNGLILLNGRSPCPFGCKKGKKPILRRNCHKKDILKKFILEELLRQKETVKYVEGYGPTGCNRDMIHCEFRGKKTSTKAGSG